MSRVYGSVSCQLEEGLAVATNTPAPKIVMRLLPLMTSLPAMPEEASPTGVTSLSIMT